MRKHIAKSLEKVPLVNLCSRLNVTSIRWIAQFPSFELASSASLNSR